MVVDSYNKLQPLNYYNRNGFVELFSTEEQEKEVTSIPKGSALPTRLLYYDLLELTASPS